MYTTTNTPYPSSRSVSPTRQRTSLVSTSRPGSGVQYHSLQDRQAVARTAEDSRPSMYASSSRSGLVGSKIAFEVPVDGMFGDPQPLSTLYHPLTNGRASVEQRPLSMPDLDSYVGPIIARSNAKRGMRASQSSSRPPPYPNHDQDTNTVSPGAELMRAGGSIRQPTAEDFLRPGHPLPASPVDEHDSDQDLPVIEPDSFLDDDQLHSTYTHHQGISSQNSNATNLNRHGTVAVANPSRVFKQEPSHKRSKSVLDTPSQAPPLVLEPTIFERESTPVRIPTMGSDMFSPALGGLHNIAGLPKKETKVERVKRFWRDMKRGGSFRRPRELGSASRQSID